MPKKKSKKKKASRRNDNSGTGTGVAAKLREMGRGWRDTIARTGGGGFPLGKNQEGIIRTIIIEESQKGNLQVTWKIEGTSEGIEDRTHYKRSMLATEENREYLRGEMETIGLTWPDSENGLGDALGEAENLAICFDVVQGKDEFVNLYFNDRLEGGSSRAAEPEKPTEDEYTKKDIIKLGKDADKDDQDSIDELTGLAKESKIDPDKYDTWAEVADEVIDDLGL